MDRLNIKLYINQSCELVAEDLTNYDSNDFNDIDYDSHISIEGLVYFRDDLADISTIEVKPFCKTSSHPEMFVSKFTFPKDGTFSYYKILVPKRSKHDSTVYYDDEQSSETFGQLVFENNVLDVRNLERLAKLGESEMNVISFEKIVFTVCKLQKCLVNLQRKSLVSELGGICKTELSNNHDRDFLLSAMYVLDYLKDRAEYEKAQEIIDSLNYCGICESLTDDSNSCGCGYFK